MNESSIDLENCLNAKPNKTNSGNLRRKINEKSQIQRWSKYYLYRPLGVSPRDIYIPRSWVRRGAGQRVITLVYFSIN